MADALRQGFGECHCDVTGFRVVTNNTAFCFFCLGNINSTLEYRRRLKLGQQYDFGRHGPCIYNAQCISSVPYTAAACVRLAVLKSSSNKMVLGPGKSVQLTEQSYPLWRPSDRIGIWLSKAPIRIWRTHSARLTILIKDGNVGGSCSCEHSF